MEEDSNDIFGKFSFSDDLSEEVKSPSGSTPAHYPGYPQNEQLVNELGSLGKAKDRFRQFLEQLGEHRRSPIREDIVHYCGEQKASSKVIENYPRPEMILKKMDIRIEKMIRTRRLKKNWGQEDLKILVWIVSKYCDLNRYTDLERDITDVDWRVIASYIPGVTAEACMFKWLSIKKITLATYKWLDPESELLQRIVVQRMGGCLSESIIKDWREISQELYRLNEDQNKVYRNAKQCKEHWNCHLNPELRKGLWQPEEDIKLLKFIRDNKGQKKWSELSRHFDGRTENALKNRHKLIVQKLQKQTRNKHKEELHLISEYLEKMMVDQLTTNIRANEQVIFDSSSDIKVEYDEEFEAYPIQRKADFLQDTNDVAITPSRVEKFNFYNLKAMDFQFLKSIQPGSISSSGVFKKMDEGSNNSNGSSNSSNASECKEEQGEVKSSQGPFTIFPVSSHFLGYRK